MVFLKPSGMPRLNDPKFTPKITHIMLLCIICIHFVLVSIAELLGVMKYVILILIISHNLLQDKHLVSAARNELF